MMNWFLLVTDTLNYSLKSKIHRVVQYNNHLTEHLGNYSEFRLNEGL